MGRMDGRKVVVTGAAGGMGRAIAERLAAEGAALALLDRDAESVAAAAATLGCSGYGCDVTDRAQVAAIITEAGAAMGGIDGLVNAAGILDITPFAELSFESWDRMLAVNVTGPFNVTRAALPLLSAAERAAIVNIASVSALMPMPGTGGYSASKAALLMLTRCLAMDLGPTIRANSICPGVIATEMTRYLWENPEHRALAAERVALKRLGTTDDIAGAALFLLGDESGFTTGGYLTVDGGFSWR